MGTDSNPGRAGWRRASRWILSGAVLISVSCGQDVVDDTTATTRAAAATTPVRSTAPVAETTTSAAPTTTSNPGASALVPSVVQVQMVVDGSVNSHGSGTVISDDGLILTNAHVATPAEITLDGLTVAVTDSAQRAPEPRYVAEVVASDPALDMAVIRAVETLGGNSYDGGLSPIPIGDSADVEIGDDLLIFGYPGIGGTTITFTRGLVSGFTGDNLVGERAWIKTDATIAGGNSGGLAANSEGELVGVPTIAGASADTDPVDCRPIRDTNRDGFIDLEDDCVPLGGFLNGVRPVDLARDLIAAATTGGTYQPIGGLSDPQGGPQPGPDDFDVVKVFFSNVTITDAEPTGPPEADLVWLGAASELCAWWQYEGMADGVTYDAIWALDGRVREDDSFISETWAGGQTGEWWVCVGTDGRVDEGIWDLTLSVEGEFIAGNWAAVGPAFATSEVTVRNDLVDTVCYLHIVPEAVPFWGPDWLASDQVMDPGTAMVLDLLPGDYALLADGCGRRGLTNALFSVPDTLEVILG